MRHAVLVPALAILLAGTTATHQASAQPANKAEAKAASDMRMIGEFIELGEYAMAKDRLTKSLADLKMAGSAVRPIAAETHVKLGVVLVLGFKNTKLATEHFTTAINIQKDIALPDFANDRAKVVFGRAYEAIHPTIKCDTLLGMWHQSVPLAQEGTPTVIEAKLDRYLLDGPMMVMYRGARGGAYKEAPLTKVDGCTFRGEIPGDGVNAPNIEYYLESRLEDGRPAARKGKAKSPFLVNVSFGPIADAPESAKPAEKPEEVAAVEPPKDDVEELLLTTPKKPKGSGCAGCQTGSEAPLGSGLLALLALVGLRRRRRA
jgi:MYXO-CTERM domain-containing protein